MLAMVKCDAGARGSGFRGGAPLGAKGRGCAAGCSRLAAAGCVERLQKERFRGWEKV